MLDPTCQENFFLLHEKKRIRAVIGFLDECFCRIHS